jgi:hypothetical protein
LNETVLPTQTSFRLTEMTVQHPGRGRTGPEVIDALDISLTASFLGIQQGQGLKQLQVLALLELSGCHAPLFER